VPVLAWGFIMVAVVVVLVVAGLGIAAASGRDGVERRGAMAEARQRAQARREARSDEA
jgi:hypothetical protein